MRVSDTSVVKDPASTKWGKRYDNSRGAKSAATEPAQTAKAENPNTTVSIYSFCACVSRRASSGIRTYTETSAPNATNTKSGILNAA